MKRLKLILLVLAIGSGVSDLYGQQLPQYSQYMFNQYAFNPAYAGSNPYWEGVSSNRYQWLGITDAPRTFTLSAQGPLKNENMAVGGYLYSDNVGPTRRLGFQGSFSYNVKLSETIKLSFGLSLGFNRWMLDADKITTYHADDFYFSNGLLISFDPDAKFGTYLYHDDWYFGASIGQLMHNKVSFLETQTGSSTFMEDHFYFTGGYTFHLGDDFDIEPHALLKFGLPAPVKFDINVLAYYKRIVWIGAGYRTNDAYTAMLGFSYKDMLRVGYAYDITHTDLKNYSNGTHELMLTFKFANSTSGAESNPSLE